MAIFKFEYKKSPMIRHEEQKSSSSLLMEEYKILKAVNEALSILLGSSGEDALEHSFTIVCDALGCDGAFLYNLEQIKKQYCPEFLLWYSPFGKGVAC